MPVQQLRSLGDERGRTTADKLREGLWLHLQHDVGVPRGARHTVVIADQSAGDQVLQSGLRQPTQNRPDGWVRFHVTGR